MESSDLDNHIVILGWNTLGAWVTEQLLAAEQRVAIVTDDPDDREVIYEEFGRSSLFVHVGSLSDFSRLEPVRIADARKVFVNFTSDEESLIAVLELQEEYGHDLTIDVVVHKENLQETFSVAGANYTVSPRALSSRIIASHIIEEDVGDFTSEFLHATEAEDDIELQQYLVTDDHEFVGETWESVFWRLKRDFNCVGLGLSRTEGDERKLHKMPDWELGVEAGDYLLVVASGAYESELEEFLGVDEGISR